MRWWRERFRADGLKGCWSACRGSRWGCWDATDTCGRWKRISAKTFDRTASHFRPYPPSEFRAALLRELGSNYEVTGTTHYLIAHPRGQQSRWAERFEDLYRSFIQYFSVARLRAGDAGVPLGGHCVRQSQRV